MVSRTEIFRYIINTLLVLIFGTMALSRCANPMAPQGGPRDSLPPVVVNITPAYGTKKFAEKRIFIEFNEYVKLKDQQKEFYISPFMEKKPTLLVKGRGVQIDIQDTLAENTTYSLNFGSSIEDNNEGNPLHSFRYVFSTGEEVDSMVMSGYTVDGFKADSVSKSFILLYAAQKDSIAEYDSTVFNCVADAVARAESNGIFIAENLKPIPYRVYAMQDNNGNQKYEPGTDLIGFLDTTYNPAEMPGFNIWYDTVRRYVTAEPQVLFRMFKDKTLKRQLLRGSSRPLQNKMILYFGDEYPQIDSLVFDSIAPSSIVREYLKPTKDSIAYWITLPKEQIPDTVKGRIIYMKLDSLNVLVRDTQKLSLGWKFFESKEKEKERVKKEKENEKLAAAGEQVPVEPNPFKYTASATGSLNPDDDLSLKFDVPISKMDSVAFSLIRTEGENQFRVNMDIVQDTVEMKTWRIKARWINNGKYRLVIPSGAIENASGESNDSIKMDFSTLDDAKFATLVLNVKGESEGSQYIIQLTDQTGKSVTKEIRHAKSGKYTIKYVPPGTVKIKVIKDVNANGEWDNGDLIARRQPERVEVFSQKDGNQEIATKEGWEIEFELDMNYLFRPVSMEDIIQRLQMEEDIRVKKYLEELKKNPPKQQKQQQQNRQSGQQLNPTNMLRR